MNRSEMLAKAGISNPHSAGGGDKFANPGVFINAYHADLFRDCYRSSYDLITKTPSELSTLRFTPGARTAVGQEITTLKGYRFTWKTLTALGMANRLERLAASPI
ncbi:MAG: hypothetical protein ACREMQ_15745 [Longimicrobiales bacterium]